MRKRIIIVTLVLSLLVISSGVLAGEMKVNVDKEGDQSSNQKVELDVGDQDFNNLRAGGGPMLGILQLDIAKLNNTLTNIKFSDGSKFSKFSDQNLILYGGGGLGGSKDGSRFGGYGLSGKLTSTNGDKKAELSINYGGFLYEKGLLVAEKTGTDVSFGLLMGGGSAELKLIYDDLGDQFNETVSSAKMNLLTKEFILLEPKINLHQQLGSFIGFDLSYGYLATYDFGETWKINDQVVSGPFDNFQTPSLTARLSFGF